MTDIDPKIKPYVEVWRRDKELLRLTKPELGIDWNSPMLTSQDAGTIFLARNERWKNPPQPFELDAASLATLVDSLVPEIEEVFGERLPQRPLVEILSRS